MSRVFPWLVGLVACAPSGAPVVEVGEDWVLTGQLPDDVDLEEAVAQLPAEGFSVWVDPENGQTATLWSTASDPRARVASADFSVAVDASCPDCGDPTCALTTRSIAITLRHEVDPGGEAYGVRTLSAKNFAGPVTTPAVFTPAQGDTVALTTVGTLPDCSTFGHTFDVVTHLRAFVTSSTMQGNFAAGGSGALTADGICQSHADAAGLGGTWMAWIRDSTRSPETRFTADGPWVRVDGTLVADDLSDLVAGTLSAPLLLDENGATAPIRMWTGFTSLPFPAQCVNWTVLGTGFQFGAVGRTDQTGPAWSADGVTTCLDSVALGCFEQL